MVSISLGNEQAKRREKRRYTWLEVLGVLAVSVGIIYYLSHPDNVFREYISPELVPQIPFLPAHKPEPEPIPLAMKILIAIVGLVVGLFMVAAVYTFTLAVIETNAKRKEEKKQAVRNMRALKRTKKDIEKKRNVPVSGSLSSVEIGRAHV